MNSSVIIGYVKDITVAKLSSSTSKTNKESGENVADFIEEIYKKLVELNKREIK